MNIFKVISLLHLLWCFQFSNASEDPFIVSFQKPGSSTWSTDEWMEYTKEIPFVKEFSACFWGKVRYFPADYVSVWQYCGVSHIEPTKSKSMECVQFYFRPNVTSSSRHIDIYAWIHSQEITVYSTRYKHRTWNHFCWIYSSNNGESKFYHNGVLVGMKTITALNDVYPTIKGDEAHEASAAFPGS